MKENTLTIKYTDYDSLDELEPRYKELMLAAQSAAKGAYAPYSKFSVGAAVMLDSGEIIKGANQENAAYPSGLCAERVALFYAGQFKDKVIAMAVSCQNEKGEYVESYPCGACLQVLRESQMRAGQNITVLVQLDENKPRVFDSADSLIPFGFTL